MIAIRPGEAAAYNWIGSVMSLLGRWDEALPFMKKAIALSKTAATETGKYYVSLAIVYAKQQRPKAA